MARTKQIARKAAPKTPSQIRKDELADAQSRIALEKSVARELAKAAKILEKDGPVDRRKTRGARAQKKKME